LRVETCKLITCLEQVPGRPILAKYQRLYFGNEFCECGFPSIDAIKSIFDLGIKTSIVTSIASRAGIQKIENVFRYLNRTGRAWEVIVNDFGVLEITREYSNLTPVLGRLLTRHVFDIDKDRLAIASLEPLELLANRYGVSRYEITNYRSKILPPDPEIPENVSLSLHYPYMYVATTRQCLFRFRNTKQNEEIEGVECDLYCKDHMFRFEYPGHIEEALYLKGNTLFVCYDSIPYSNTELNQLHVDRIVYSSDLPV